MLDVYTYILIIYLSIYVGVGMEKEFGRIKKNDTTEIVIKADDFGGQPGVTIREFVTSERYTGFTKNGTKVPKDRWDDFVKVLTQVKFEQEQEKKQ
jgi:hypothetical protein